MTLQAFNAQEGFHFEFNYQEHVCKSPLGNMKSASGMVDEYVAIEKESSRLLSLFAQNERKDTNQPIWDYQNKRLEYLCSPLVSMCNICKMTIYFMNCFNSNISRFMVRTRQYTHCQSRKYIVQLLDQVIKQ